MPACLLVRRRRRRRGGGRTLGEYFDSDPEELLVRGTGVADGEGGDAGDAVETRARGGVVGLAGCEDVGEDLVV